MHTGIDTGALELVRVLSRAATRHWLQSGLGHELSAADMWLLLHLSRTAPIAMSELARWQQVSRSTMTSEVLHLERRGLLAREPGAGDHRVVVVRLTDRGREAAQVLHQSVAAAFDAAVDGWPQADRDLLAQLLARLVEGLERTSRRS